MRLQLTILLGALLVALAPPAAWGETWLGANDEVPEVLERFEPTYPESAWIAGVEGVAVVQALIDSLGRVKDWRPNKGSPTFMKAAADAVVRWRFTPGRVDGRPIAVWIAIPIRFRLEETLSPDGGAPRPLVDRPARTKTAFPARPQAKGDPHRSVAQAAVDAGGTVRDVRFATAAPRDSQAVREAIFTWKFVERRDVPDEPAIEWVRIPIVRPTDAGRQESGLQPNSPILR